jgi:hypothetical protein
MFFESKLALRLRRPTTWYGLASISVIAALAVVVSLLTWWNDLYRPIVHPIEAITRVHPGEALEQVDEQVASLLGVDKESVRSVREGLIGGPSSGIPQLAGKLYEVAAIHPAGTGSSWPASSVVPKGDGAGAPPEELSSPMLTEPSLTPMNGESPVPSADDTPALPAQREESPSSSPATETTQSPPGGSSSEPPTSTTDPSPVTPADSSSSSVPTDSSPPPSTGSLPHVKGEPPSASDPSSPSTASPPPSPSSSLSPPTGTAPPLLLTNALPPSSPPLPSPTKTS